MIALSPGPRVASDPSTHGFVLVGVVMFVLALTILAFSLFSLSSYEAQFLNDSHNRSQAFYDAVGAIERAKFVLGTTNGDLSAASTNLPPGVTFVRATQEGDSTIDWSSSTPVLIQATATEASGSSSESVSLSASFNVQEDRSLYRDVVATPGPFSVIPDSADIINMTLDGSVRAQNKDPWQSLVSGAWTFGGGGVPQPQVKEFIDYWKRYAEPNPPSLTEFTGSPATSTYTFDLRGRDFAVFYSDFWKLNPLNKANRPEFGFTDGHLHDVYVKVVNGKPGAVNSVIWLLPNGSHFADKVTFSGFDCNFIMVADVARDSAGVVCDTCASQYQPLLGGVPPGMWFRGGVAEDLNSPARLFLVTSGALLIDRDADPAHNVKQTDQTLVSYASLFAGAVVLSGPQATASKPVVMELEHSTSFDNVLLDRLYNLKFLPNTMGANHRFSLIPGTWQQLAAAPTP